jgi:Na+/H+-translocating membrane pyrophosphatase
MRTAVPGLCGTVIVLRAFMANVRSFAGFSAVLLVMFMRTVGTSTMVADVGTDPARMVTQNIPEENRCNGVTIAVKTGDNAG